MKEDLYPFLGQFLTLISFLKIAFKNKIHIVDATTIDIEYNSREES